VQQRDNLQRLCFWLIDDYVIGEFSNGPKTYRQRSKVLPLGSVPVIFRYKLPDGIKVFRRLRHELKRGTHP